MSRAFLNLGENELSNLLMEGRLIELCEIVNSTNELVIKEWFDKEQKNYIKPLKSNSKIDDSKMLYASCLLGIKLAKERNGVTTTQLRRLLNGFQETKEAIKVSDSNIDVAEISKLKFHLAYVTARNNRSNMKVLTDILDSLLSVQKIKSKEDFNSVVTLLEGTVAFHKLAGGSE